MTAEELARSLRRGGEHHRRLMKTILKYRREAVAKAYAETRARWPRWTGNSEKNWIPWSGKPSRRVVFPPAADLSLYIGAPKGYDSADERAALSAFSSARSVNVDIGFSHNGPEARVIEYGLYPDPPKRGSRIPGTTGFVKLSESGFSKQAPGGAVRLALQAVAARYTESSRTIPLEA